MPQDSPIEGRGAAASSRPRPADATPHSTEIPSSVPDTDHTEQAPSFQAPCPPHASSPASGLGELLPGAVIAEFEIIDILGRGGFGVVYLARERSLDRQVALKISPDAGTEGRNLARLEHENIVQVYSEQVDASRTQRLLCMQYVAGMTLGELISRLWKQGETVRSGSGILRLLDQTEHPHARFEPSALRDRTLLEDSDFIEAVCLLVSRLSEALTHAHERDILHLDIKPNNILISQYGRPYLMDFNLSFQSLGMDEKQPQLVGGTLPYMSPEHLEVFLNRSEEARARLDGRTDTYSLGVVLFELLEGRLPFDAASRGDLVSTVQAMIAERRGRGNERLRIMDTAPEVLHRVVRRSLEPSPDNRYQSAAELLEDLEGCRRLHRIQRLLPRPGWLVRQAIRRPWSYLILCGLLPHLVGSVVQIAYNATRIVSELSLEQQKQFGKLVLGFNPVVYSASLVWLLYFILPVHRTWRRIMRDPGSAGPELDASRQDAVLLPSRAAWVGGMGWLAGAFFFPIALHLRTGGLTGEVWLHFGISFFLAGSIAVAYGFIMTQYLLLRVIYPEMWYSPANLHRRSVKELRGIESRMSFFQTLAAVIPLLGAVIMVTVGPDEFTADEYGAFRILVTLLILSGMLGARLAATVGRLTSSVIHAFTGRSPLARD